MNGIIYLLAISLFTLDWLAFTEGVVGRVATWMPEFLSLIAMVLVAALVARGRVMALPYRYATWLVVFLLLVAGWALVNGVAAGTLIVGLRGYLKYIPFFLLPIVYRFEPAQLRRQLLFLLFLSMIQLPVAIYQRFVAFAGWQTGDVVGGTLGQHTSGVLSVYLACAIAITVSFYVKERIRLITLLLLLPILAAPTMLNETKVSLLLLPAAVFGPLVIGRKIGGDLRKSFALIVGGVVIMVAFVHIYATLRGSSIIDFFTSKGTLEHYLYKGGDPRLADTVSRFDSINLAVKQLSRDNDLLLGVGAGNASPSFSEKLTGEYYKKYYYMEPTLVYLTKVLWELGVLGAIVFGVFFAMTAMDSYRLIARDDLIGALALGWFLVSGFIAASFLYFKTFDTNVIGYLYWYFSGHIVAETYRYRSIVTREPMTYPIRVHPTKQRIGLDG